MHKIQLLIILSLFSFSIAAKDCFHINSKDIILHYSINGKCNYPQQTITLLWELYPEMEYRLKQLFTKEINLIKDSGLAKWLTVTSELMIPYYMTNMIYYCSWK